MERIPLTFRERIFIVEENIRALKAENVEENVGEH
jgi:hypothetical protein